MIQSSDGIESFCSKERDVKPGTISSYVISNFLKTLSILSVKIYGLSTESFSIFNSKNDVFGLSDNELVF